MGLNSGMVVNKNKYVLYKRYCKRLQLLMYRNKIKIYIEGEIIESITELKKYLQETENEEV